MYDAFTVSMKLMLSIRGILNLRIRSVGMGLSFSSCACSSLRFRVDRPSGPRRARWASRRVSSFCSRSFAN